MCWLDTAKKITNKEGERRENYGHPLMNFMGICLVWNIYDAGHREKGDYLIPLSFGHFMSGMKMIRDTFGFKDDNWLDNIGYSSCIQMVDEELKERGYPDGIEALYLMNIQEMFDIFDDMMREFLKAQREERLANQFDRSPNSSGDTEALVSPIGSCVLTE